MNRKANSFFIVDCSQEVSTALPVARAGELSRVILQQIANAQESFEAATKRLLRLAELSHGARDYDALRELSAALQAVPFAPAQNAACYYLAIIAKRDGRLDAAADLLASIDAPRAIHTLGTVYKAKGDHQSAARFYLDALRAARLTDPLTVINASIEIATVKSIAGDSRAALADLESLWPMVRTFSRLHPHLFYQFHNELAVELAAVGDVEAAQRAVAVAIASPIAAAYPEWHETAAEVAPARVVVTVVKIEASEPVKPLLELSFYSTLRRPFVASSRNQPIIKVRANLRASPRAPPSCSLLQ